MKRIALIDSCYWLGLVDSKDQHHEASLAIARRIHDYNLIFPWPCMYESVSTRLIRNREKTLYFEKLITKTEVQWLNDEKYRKRALNEVFESARKRGTSYSLVDCVLREILKNKDLSIECLVTYNKIDFQDICDIEEITIING